MIQTAIQGPPQPPRALSVSADVTQPPLTANTNDHVAAAYLMKHARATVLMVLDAVTGQPKGNLTEAHMRRGDTGA
jgi:hypothetical protein